MDNFVNLHVHTLFSKSDSVIKINDLVNKVKEYDQQAVAVTDHSSTAAHYYLREACKNNGIKPIYGNEFYLNKNYEEKDRNRDHLVFLAMTDEGLQNINRMQDIANGHHYYKPILSYDIISDFSDGIYCTSACSLGIISKSILDGNIDTAINWANRFMDIFDGNFSLELQLHPEYHDQAIVNEGLLKVHKELDIPLTISTDAHFIESGINKKARRAIQAISWKKKEHEIQESLKSNCLGSTDIVMDFANQLNFDLDIVNDAINQTSKIANLCNADLCEDNKKVPIFDKHTEFDMLIKEAL